jgi:hypothetical protein
MNGFEEFMKHEELMARRKAYAVHMDMLNTELKAWDINIQTIATGSSTLDGEGELEKSMDCCQKRLEYIKKHEHLGKYFKAYVQYLYENIMVLQGDDEFSTPYTLEESFEDWGRWTEMHPRYIPKDYVPDIHEGALDKGEYTQQGEEIHHDIDDESLNRHD